MADVNRGNRPLSPHLTIYRPQLTSMTSILTRITGNALLIAALMVVWWFLAAAISPEAFAWADWALTSILGDLILLGSVWALWYHLLAGVRHLIWDNALTIVGAGIVTTMVAGLAFSLGPLAARPAQVLRNRE